MPPISWREDGVRKPRSPGVASATAFGVVAERITRRSSVRRSSVALRGVGAVFSTKGSMTEEERSLPGLRADLAGVVAVKTSPLGWLPS
jgi:hypothetical protein